MRSGSRSPLEDAQTWIQTLRHTDMNTDAQKQRHGYGRVNSVTGAQRSNVVKCRVTG